MSTSIIRLSWVPPEEDSQNGIIRRYTVTVAEIVSSTLSQIRRRVTSTRERVQINNLRPFTNYSVAVAASTVAIGPFSPLLRVTTLVDGKSCDSHAIIRYPLDS